MYERVVLNCREWLDGEYLEMLNINFGKKVIDFYL